MTDEERLEEIKQTLKHPNYTKHNGQEVVFYMVSENDLNYLIERVQELEDQKLSLIEEMGQVDERFLELEHQNKRRREALERIKDNVPLEFEHKSEYEAKKNVIRLMNIQKEVDEALQSD